MSYPRENIIRASLIERAKIFRSLTGIPLSTISKSAVNDSAFIADVSAGCNFTVERYQRVQTWLDRHWPRSKKPNGNGGS